MKTEVNFIIEEGKMETVNFSFRKIWTMIFLIVLVNSSINAQEKPATNQSVQSGSVSVPEAGSKMLNQQQGQTQEPEAVIQGSKPVGSESASDAKDVKTAKPKQVKASRPVLSQTKGARPPTIIRPSGSGIPKGTGNPGGAVGPGRR